MWTIVGIFLVVAVLYAVVAGKRPRSHAQQTKSQSPGKLANLPESLRQSLSCPSTPATLSWVPGGWSRMRPTRRHIYLLLSFNTMFHNKYMKTWCNHRHGRLVFRLCAM